VSGTPDQISDDEVPIPGLHVISPPQPSAYAAAPSPADSDDEVPIPCFSHRIVLVSCYGDVEVPLPRPGVLCLSSSPSCSPSTCPAGWRPQPMPSQVWFMPICFFFYLPAEEHAQPCSSQQDADPQVSLGLGLPYNTFFSLNRLLLSNFGCQAGDCTKAKMRCTHAPKMFENCLLAQLLSRSC
jgi:hypothetical protein